MQKVRIEEMKLSHLDDIMEIESSAYGKHHWSRDSFVSEINNDISRYICVSDPFGKCFGYLGIWKIFDEAHITNLAVHPDWQGKKIGQLLMIEALKNCYKEKIKYITLEVRVSNAAAKALYEKFGFKSLGVRKKYYQDNNEDALIMWTENIFGENFKLRYNKIKANLETMYEVNE